MTENRLRRVRSVYGICLSALTAVVGALFIAQVWSIFFSAEQDPYTVEIVAEKFWQISVPVFLWVAALIGGGVLALAFPAKKERLKADVSAKTALERLQRRIVGGGKELPEVKKQEEFRLAVCSVAIALCLWFASVGCLILFGLGPIFKLGGAFFSAHVEAVRLLSMLPWALGALAVIAVTNYLFEYSYGQELKGLKDAIATKKVEMGKPVNAEKTLNEKFFGKFSFLRSPKFLFGVRIGLCVVGVVFVIVGIFNGGMADVLTKAINICTQCIGLG